MKSFDLVSCYFLLPQIIFWYIIITSKDIVYVYVFKTFSYSELLNIMLYVHNKKVKKFI
jgi:hypothetical protein